MDKDTALQKLMFRMVFLFLSFHTEFDADNII